MKVTKVTLCFPFILAIGCNVLELQLLTVNRWYHDVGHAPKAGGVDPKLYECEFPGPHFCILCVPTSLIDQPYRSLTHESLISECPSYSKITW